MVYGFYLMSNEDGELINWEDSETKEKYEDGAVCIIENFSILERVMAPVLEGFYKNFIPRTIIKEKDLIFIINSIESIKNERAYDNDIAKKRMEYSEYIDTLSNYSRKLRILLQNIQKCENFFEKYRIEARALVRANGISLPTYPWRPEDMTKYIKGEWEKMPLKESSDFRWMQYVLNLKLSTGDNPDILRKEYENNVYELTHSPIILDAFGHIVFLMKDKIIN